MLPEKNKKYFLPTLVENSKSAKLVERQQNEILSFAQDENFGLIMQYPNNEQNGALGIYNVFKSFGDMDSFSPDLEGSNPFLPQDWIQRIFLAKQSPSISLLKKVDKNTLKIVLLSLIRYAIQASGGKNDNLPLELTIFDLLQSQWQFKIKEVFLIFRMGLNGNFGKIYGSVSSQDVAEWIKAYNVMSGDYAVIQNKSAYKEWNYAPNVEKAVANIIIQKPNQN